MFINTSARPNVWYAHDILEMLEQVFIKPARIHSKNGIHDVSSPIRRINTPLKEEKWLASITNVCIAEHICCDKTTI